MYEFVFNSYIFSKISLLTCGLGGLSGLLRCGRIFSCAGIFTHFTPVNSVFSAERAEKRSRCNYVRTGIN